MVEEVAQRPSRDLVTWAQTWVFVVVPAVIAGALAGASVTRAPLWRDEMATWQFAELGWRDLGSATSHGDRVLVPYYALMHVVDALTPGLVALRLPSVLAGVVAVVFTALIAERLWSPKAGFLAGLALAVNGSFVRLAVEARPGVLAVAGCAASTWALLRLLDADAPRWRDWALFGLLAAAATAMQPFAVLVLPVQALLVITRRSQWSSFVLAATTAVLVSAGLVAAGFGDRSQIGWIPDPSLSKVADILVQVAGGGLGATVVVVAVLVLLAGAVLGRSESPARGAWLALGLVAVPVLGLLIVSVAVEPVFVGRYLSAVPVGLALLVGAAGHTLDGLITVPVLRRLLLVLAPTAVVAGLVPGLSVAFERNRGDDFPALTALIEHVVRPGDRLVVHQATPTSGFLAGIVEYSGDELFRKDLRAGLVHGLAPDTWRVVSARLPLRTRAITPWAPGASTWYVARVGRDGQALGWQALRVRGCRRSFEQHVERAALLRVNCPG